MKKYIFASLMLLACTAASAQFANSKSGSASSASNDGYNAVYFQYNPMSMTDGSDSESGFTGLAVGYKAASSVSSTAPLFVEYGAAFQYTMYDKHDEKVNMGSVVVPVNLTYRYQLPNSQISLCPYAGLNAKIHLFGTSKYGSYSSANLFDSDDMGSEGVFKRFQLGYQIGLNVAFSSFYVGIGYGSDFTDLAEDIKMSTTSITVGLDI